MSLEVSGVKIIADKGSITVLTVDAANSGLRIGRGVAGSIRRFGGSAIEEEALRHAPVPIGRAVATTAGRLRAKRVIHALAMTSPGPTTVEDVYKAAKAALECAEEIGAESIAVPGMGTGVGGVPRARAAEAIVKAVVEHVRDGMKLEKIVSGRRPVDGRRVSEGP